LFFFVKSTIVCTGSKRRCNEGVTTTPQQYPVASFYCSPPVPETCPLKAPGTDVTLYRGRLRLASLLLASLSAGVEHAEGARDRTSRARDCTCLFNPVSPRCPI